MRSLFFELFLQCFDRIGSGGIEGELEHRNLVCLLGKELLPRLTGMIPGLILDEHAVWWRLREDFLEKHGIRLRGEAPCMTFVKEAPGKGLDQARDFGGLQLPSAGKLAP